MNYDLLIFLMIGIIVGVMGTTIATNYELKEQIKAGYVQHKYEIYRIQKVQ